MHVSKRAARAGAIILTWAAAAAATAEPASLSRPAARPLTVVPGQADRVADATPAPASARPRPAMVWEAIEPAAAAATVNTHTIYLHRCAGSDCTVTQGATNSTTDPVHSSLGHGVLTAFSQGDATWSAVVACMKDVYAPFHVTLTETNPGASPHFEIMVGGKAQEIGLPAGVGGVSPFSCVPYIPNSVVFVFDVWGNDAEEICATAAQEIAHSFSLDHAIEPTDPMTYFSYKGRRRYMNAQVQCGSDCDKDHRSPLGATCSGDTFQHHECACGSGSQTQNDYQTIATLFGDGSSVSTPPTVKIVSPKVGDTVTGNFPVRIEAADDTAVTSTELRVDGALISTLAASPYAFTGPAALADGTHIVEVAAYDGNGAAGRARVEVIVGPGCTAATDCAGGQTCVGGRCVAGPGVTGGLGTTCATATDCVSWQCANADGARYCVESCKAGQCPDGFGCRNDGAGGGVCWPGYDDSSAGCDVAAGGARTMPLGSGVLGLGLLALALRRRRADRATPRA